MFRPTALLLALAMLAGCKNGSGDPNHIRVGITSGPESSLAEAARKEALEKYNLEVELVAFNDYVMPNEALQSGDVDVNVFQHVPYLEEQSRQRGYKLEVVGRTFVYPIAAYSKKVRTIEQLAEGSTIVIPNDPTNAGRALLLLQQSGLLQLREQTGLLPRVNDITVNPRQLNILQIEASQIPRILDDKDVAMAVINNNFAAQAGLTDGKYEVLKEDKASPYVNVIVSREDNRDAEKVKKFVKAYQSEAVEAAAREIFRNGAVKGWE